MFQGSGQRLTTFGFEYYGHPKHRDDGYVMWQVDGQPTHRVGAGAVGADPLPTGSGIARRVIPEEPMAIILNLGMSRACLIFRSTRPPLSDAMTMRIANWQTIDLSTMTFPGEMLVDYVRVYQRKNEINIGCDPVDYPTAKYIQDHLDPYMSACFVASHLTLLFARVRFA